MASLGGALKYKFVEEKKLFGLPFLVYQHVGCNGPLAGILLHTHEPMVAVKHSVIWNDDQSIVAVEYRVAASDNYIFSKFFFANDTRREMDQLPQNDNTLIFHVYFWGLVAICIGFCLLHIHICLSG